MSTLRASVIISFYNNLPFLKSVLAGLDRQTEKRFEVIIADDGSRKDVTDQLAGILKSYSFDILHVWHEDNGWQKNKIINEALRRISSDYVIFLDGDCIPHRAFVSEHLKNAAPNTILTGRRAYLSEKFSSQLSPEKIKDGFLENVFRLILNKTWQWENALYLGNTPLKSFFNKKAKGVLGCNFSISKETIELLNGFDERYVHPTVGEDTDIEHRLRNAGYKVKTLKFLAVQYHLWHKKLSREMNSHNQKILQEAIDNNTVATEFGLKQRA